MASAEQVVRDFCAAASGGVPRRCGHSSLTTWCTTTSPWTRRGDRRDHGADHGFMGMFEKLEFEIHHLASDGPTVLTERTDHFTLNGKTAPLPVMGAFHVVDGKITAWRDYFDMGQVTAMLSGD